MLDKQPAVGSVTSGRLRGRDVLVIVSVFLTLTMLATTGLVDGANLAQAGPGGSYFAEGDITGSNPASGDVIGVTEADFIFNCTYPPDSQGVDGWVFELPDGFSLPAPFTVKGTSDAPYDLDVTFFDVDCAELDSVATTSPDESGEVPAETKYVLATLFLGAQTHVALCVGDPAGCVAGSPSASPSGSPSEEPPIQGEQQVSIQTDSSMKKFRKPFVLSGTVNGDAECGPPQSHFVGVSRKVLGSKGDYKSVDRRVPVRRDGSWSKKIRAPKSARYRATVSPSAACPPERAGPVIVRVRAKISKLLSNDQGGCGPKKYFGRVKPTYPGTNVKLERRKNRRWKGMGIADNLNNKSKFAIKVPKCGSFRIVWPQQARSNAKGFRRLHRQG